MSDEDLSEFSTRIDGIDYANVDDEGDCFSITRYQHTNDGHFR